MDAGELVDFVYENVADIEADRYSPARIVRLLNLAQVAFNRETKILKAEAILSANSALTGPSASVYTFTFSAALVAMNVVTASINGGTIVTNFAGSSAATLAAFAAALLGFAGVASATASGTKVTVTTLAGTLLVTPSVVVTLGASQANVAIVNTTPAYPFWTVPSDLYIIEGLEALGLPIDFVSETYLRRRFVDWRKEAGNPLFAVYGRWGFDIRMVPFPTDTLLAPTLSYVRNPKKIELAGTPDIPVAYHEALGHWATAWILTQDDDYRDASKATIHHNDYAVIEQKALSDTASRMVKTPRRVNRGRI
jgi:hypothetical protein